MRVLILGGTTFFGKSIVRQFVEGDHEVSVFTRGTKKSEKLTGVRYLQGDRNRLEDLKKCSGPWGCVVDNIAYDGEGVRASLAALGEVGRYVLTSTVSVYRFAREPFNVPWREQSVAFNYTPPAENPSDVHWKYARGKLEAERALRDQARVPWTIVRPTVVYGPHDPLNRGFWYLERMRAGGPILLANGGVGSFRLVDSTDVATGIYLAALAPQAAGMTYNLAQSEIITLEEFLRESARALGVEPKLVPVPLQALGELGGPHAKLINTIPETRAAEALGFKPTPFATFAQKTAHWFLKNWDGDRAELLKTRPEELALAASWTHRVS